MVQYNRFKQILTIIWWMNYVADLKFLKKWVKRHVKINYQIISILSKILIIKFMSNKNIIIHLISKIYEVSYKNEIKKRIKYNLILQKIMSKQILKLLV